MNISCVCVFYECVFNKNGILFEFSVICFFKTQPCILEPVHVVAYRPRASLLTAAWYSSVNVGLVGYLTILPLIDVCTVRFVCSQIFAPTTMP